MTIEITRDEAEILIAILTGAEGAFAVVSPPLVKALDDLRPFRTKLLQGYLRSAGADSTEACPGPGCPSCNGERCNLCDRTQGHPPYDPPCEHDNADRHA